MGSTEVLARHPAARGTWLFLGVVSCGFGFAGIALPGLPATVFFIAAAACFARSSPRLLNWILSLPTVGPLVRDYRAGRGMPGRAKLAATTMMMAAGTISLLALRAAWLQILVVALLGIGIAVIWLGVPTAAPDPDPDPGS